MNPNTKYIYVDEDTSRLLQSIKSERKKLKLSLRQLAAILGINYRSLNYYENGSKTPSLANFLRIAEFFNWDISNNVSFLYSQYVNNLNYFRKFKLDYDFSCRKLQELTHLRKTTINNLFLGKGSILSFALIKEVFDEERRLIKFRRQYNYPTKHRKKVLS